MGVPPAGAPVGLGLRTPPGGDEGHVNIGYLAKKVSTEETQAATVAAKPVSAHAPNFHRLCTAIRTCSGAHHPLHKILNAHFRGYL